MRKQPTEERLEARQAVHNPQLNGVAAQPAVDQIPEQPFPHVASLAIPAVEPEHFDFVVFGDADNRQKRHAIDAIRAADLEIRAIEEQELESASDRCRNPSSSLLTCATKRDTSLGDLLAEVLQADALNIAPTGRRETIRR